MALARTVATVTLRSMAPFSQSRKHEDEYLEGESHDNYNKRTWRSQALVENGSVCVAAQAFHQALVAAAKYSKRQIPGQGKATWTAKFQAGVVLLENVSLNIKPEELQYIDIYANADGIRGSGKRVMRRFPIIPKWEATFSINILDPIITKDTFEEILEIAGMFIGIGRYRPEKGGTNGRFEIVNIDWQDERQPIRRRAA